MGILQNLLTAVGASDDNTAELVWVSLCLAQAVNSKAHHSEWHVSEALCRLNELLYPRNRQSDQSLIGLSDL